MELTLDTQNLLKQFPHAAFASESGVVVDCNQLAKEASIEIGQKTDAFFADNRAQYDSFAEGCLCLPLTIDDLRYDATILRNGSSDIVFFTHQNQDKNLKLLNSVARSLREPLSSAMFASQGLECELDDDSRMQQLSRSLIRLHRDISNMADAINLSKPRPAKMMTYDLVSILDELTQSAASQLALTEHTVRFFPTYPFINTVVDREKLERAVLNLISNAAKYGTSGHPITIKLDQRDKRVYISVTNHTESTFQAIYHELNAAYLQDPSLGKYCGLGLGLTVVRNIMFALEGTLLFDQPRDNTFRATLSFPIRIARDGALHADVVYPLDYLGGYDKALTELADLLPPEAF